MTRNLRVMNLNAARDFSVKRLSMASILALGTLAEKANGCTTTSYQTVSHADTK